MKHFSWTVVVAVVGGTSVGGCDRAAPPPDSGDQAVAAPPAAISLAAADSSVDLGSGPLAALPTQVKASDFRVTPPPVDTIYARAASDGSTIAQVRFRPDARIRGAKTLTLSPEGQPWVLHDDGDKTAGDLQAGDGVFSVVTPVPFTRILDEQQGLRVQLAKRKITSIPRFDGITLVDRSPVPLLTLDGFGVPLLHSLAFLIDPERSLLVRHVSVTEDPSRTGHPCTGAGAPQGKWSFSHLISEMAGTTPPATFMRQFFDLLRTGEAAPNGTMMFGSPNIQSMVIDPWPKLADGSLDLDHAPLKLLAIVNRIDLASNPAYGVVGGAEGRFVFEIMDASPGAHCAPLGSTGVDPLGAAFIIVEYGVPITSCTDLRTWANQWIALSSLAIGSPAYNAVLESLTERFVARNAAPSKPNGSALNQIRVNEIAPDPAWNLRQIQLTDTGFHAGNTAQTPALSFDSSTPGSLATWVNANATSILSHTQTVPAFLGTTPFLGARIFNDPPGFWNVNGASSNALRHAFSLDTCNGCHGRDTGTTFSQVGHPLGNEIGFAATISGFLAGETGVHDPVVPTTTYSFSELLRRAGVLENLASSMCLARPGDLIPERPFHLPIPPLDVQPMIQGH